MSCINNILKYTLLAINAFYSLLGIILIILGRIILLYQNEENHVETISVVVIFSGCVLLLVTLFGCCGVIGDGTYLILAYIVCMVLLIAGKIYVALEVQFTQLDKIIQYGFNSLFDDTSTRDIFFLLESLLACCGTTGAGSYELLNVTLPITCCPIPDQLQLCSKEEAYSGCTQVIIDMANSTYSGIYYTIIAITVVEVVGVVFACFLLYDFRIKRKARNYYQRYQED